MALCTCSRSSRDRKEAHRAQRRRNGRRLCREILKSVATDRHQQPPAKEEKR